MRPVLGRAHAKPRDRWADGVKAVSRRRRGRVSASLEAGRSPVYSTQLLPGVHDLLVTVARAMRKHCHALGTSQGVPEPHSFAVRIKCCSSVSAFASTASRPAFVTTRPPLLSRRDGGKISTVSDSRKDKYFRANIWTAQISLILHTKPDFARTRFRRLKTPCQAP